MNNLKHKLLILIALFPFVCSAQVDSLVIKQIRNELQKGSFRFIILNDAGHNGYKDQKIVAETMGVIAEAAEVRTILSAGDQLHFSGVQHKLDPFWISNFEMIYTHPQLLKSDWYAIPGNHEYRGNVDAFIAYNEISSRWKMPARYYTLSYKLQNKKTLRVLMLDTTPMMERYRGDAKDEAAQQDYKKQLVWADSVLTHSPGDWNFIVGHHPIYANTSKKPSQQADMQRRLEPILKKHKADFYVSGHIHNFQHIIKSDSPIHYIVNTSAGNSRSIKDHKGLEFGYDKTGFILGEVSDKFLIIRLINSKGEIVYSIKKEK